MSSEAAVTIEGPVGVNRKQQGAKLELLGLCWYRP